MAARVLVVDDEKDLRALLEYALGEAGLSIVGAAGGREALARIAEAAPDLVVLDLLLPDIPGLDVLKAIRRDRPALPVILLTAKGEEIDRVLGLELGADDYVVKPFSVRELVLRVKAVLRRGEAPEEAAETLRHRDLVVDGPRHQVTVGGKGIPLSPTEFRLLTTLLARRGRVQTRSMLLTEVWGLSGDLDTRTVDTHIKRLREKLGPAGAYVETVVGFGYRFQEEEG